MTTYNERLDDVLDTLVENAADSDSRLGYVEAYEHAEKAKQAITSLIKELVAEAKPSGWVYPKDTDDPEWQGYSSGITDFEQNLLKALEEV